MREGLGRRLDDLLGRVVDLGERVDLMLGDACAALRDGDVDAAEGVVRADAQVDRIDDELQQGVFMTIALHGPVGGDLRLLTALLRASLRLERMGDYAANVARAAARSATLTADGQLTAQLIDMGDVAREVGRRAVQAFVHGDEELALWVPRRDADVDRLDAGISGRLVRLAATDPDRLEWAMQMVLVPRLIERYGDHGVGLAEQALFVTTGVSAELSDATSDGTVRP